AWLRIAARQEHTDAWIDPPQRLQRLVSVHPRHGQIEHDGNDARALLAIKGDGLVSGAGATLIEAQTEQHLPAHAANWILVVYHQHQTGAVGAHVRAVFLNR